MTHNMAQSESVSLNHKLNISYQIWVLFVGALLMIVKFTAWGITGSNAILSDALESFVNIFAGAFALFSLYLAARPKDSNHPYGHGKIEFLSATLEGSMISIAGLFIIIKAIYNLFFPESVKGLDTGIVLTLVAGVVNGIMGYLLLKRGNKVHSITLISGGKHLLSDAWSTAGLICGLLLIIITDLLWIDNIVAILFGIYILYTGLHILRKSIAGIMDETDYDILKPLMKQINENRRPHWIDLHNLRVIRYGSTLHVDCHMTIPWYLNVKQAHDEADLIEKQVHHSGGMPLEWFVHIDPCHEGSCKICSIEDCPVRVHPFQRTIIWDETNLLKNRNHGA
jgi:cation diffusion facilitator family transporter